MSSSPLAMEPTYKITVQTHGFSLETSTSQAPSAARPDWALRARGPWKWPAPGPGQDTPGYPLTPESKEAVEWRVSHWADSRTPDEGTVRAQTSTTYGPVNSAREKHSSCHLCRSPRPQLVPENADEMKGREPVCMARLLGCVAGGAGGTPPCRLVCRRWESDAQRAKWSTPPTRAVREG